MGRHGGGSRGGGSSRSSSRSSSSRGGGSSIRTSRTPFRGCYNRSYYDRRGRFHSYYTSDKNFGSRNGWNIGMIFALCFITFHMLIMVGAFVMSSIQFGSKVNGDTERITIVDKAEILSTKEEQEILVLFREIYDKSGMPITLYTDDFSWKEHYEDLEVYSEELYYQIGYDEDAMIILFTTDNDEKFMDWEYDVYCGDDTIQCFSDSTFDKYLERFQKGMANQDLAYALDYAWNSVMDELAETTVSEMIVAVPFLLIFYAIFYIAILGSVKKKNVAYKYFKENPEKLSKEPMTLYGKCPNCGASNTAQAEVCPYCNSLLKISDGKVEFVKTN